MTSEKNLRSEETRHKMGRLLVGVCSREEVSCYQWLVVYLLSLSAVRDVRTVTITNRFQNFQDEVSKCDFAILYHSKRRGRLNITDVTDSLYDEELQHLSIVFGKKKVLVVLDDLENSSEEEKSRILSHQQSIQRLAQDLFLFSTEDKASLSGPNASPGANRSLEDMKRIIEGYGANRRDHYGTPGHTDTDPVASGQGRGRVSRRCVLIIIIIILIIVIGLIIGLTHSKTHVPVTSTPAYSTVTSAPSTISNTTSAQI
ncbi:uncharacterized protein [Engystomops pustulosus]|uniref:uncharacterized protein isoform X1 n=1 Tax=Engystomops pustulosus TaxID=76066 RepID=UPI003AFB18E6